MFASSIKDEERMKLEKRGYVIGALIEEGLNSSVYLTDYKPSIEVDIYQDIQTPMASPIPIQLACKVVDASKMPKTLGIKFFLRELDILTKISHPHIIHVHSIIQCTNKFFVFMRFAELGNLCNYILAHGPLKEKQTRSWIRQLIVAVIYLHTLDIAHRDIKCENLLITANHNLKLADFGFSRVVVNKKGKEVLSTTFCGSLSYSAPELLRGTRYFPKLADIWSIGTVFYIMLNASMPFDASNVVQLYSDQMNKNYRFRSSIRPKVSQQVVDLVDSLLEPEPKKRLPLEMVLKSRWIRAVLKYRQLNDQELQALETALGATTKMKDKAFSKLNDKAPFAMLREEREVNPSAPNLHQSIDAEPEALLIENSGGEGAK